MPSKPRVCAVSFLNTTPLVWGMVHGPQKDVLDVTFRLPSECADLLRSGQVDIGLVPSVELARQPDLVVIPGCSISSVGEVGSILLISRKPVDAIESVAADTSSRTSVALSQIILARKYHRHVKIRPYPPRVEEMLDIADAALVIGDPALQFEARCGGAAAGWGGFEVRDLGSEWYSLTRLPMVFAVWGVRRPAADPALAAIFQASARFGLAHVDEIASAEGASRGITAERAEKYLSSQIRFSWGEAERRGLSLFLEYAAELGLAPRRASLETLDEPALAR